MRLTKFLWRKCKVCMRILLLKSLFLGTNCPSFLPILCGILFVSAVDSFLFLPWIPFCFYCGFVSVSAVDSFCFCRGFVFVAVDLFLSWIPLCIYLLTFSLFSLVPSIFSHEIRKTWEFFWKKSIVFLKISIVFRKKSIVFFVYSLTSNV